LDSANLTLFAGLFLLLYNAYGRTLKYLDVYSKIDLIKDLLYEVLIIGLEIGIYRFTYTTSQKKHKQDKEKIHRLEQENQELEEKKKELSVLYEQVKSKTIDSQEAIDTAQNIIERIQNSIFKQQETYKSDEVSTDTDNDDNAKNDMTSKIHLTKREKEVLLLLVQGLLNKEIADRLGIAVGRVNNIVKHIFTKTKVTNKTQLAVFAIKYGLVDINEINIETLKDDNDD
jgi:DNA-binding CsgD family transcriptional regulator